MGLCCPEPELEIDRWSSDQARAPEIALGREGERGERGDIGELRFTFRGLREPELGTEGRGGRSDAGGDGRGKLTGAGQLTLLK
jgi:hypothetical protein